MFRRLSLLLVALLTALAVAQSPQMQTVDEVLFQEIGDYGGTLTLSLTSAPLSFNYFGVIDAASYTVLGNVFDPLIGVNPVTYELVPALAESWEVLEEENAVIFHLRPGVTWHDGEPFTADDVIFTFDNIIMNENARGNETARFTLGEEVVTLEKIDDLTVRANLPVPYGAFFQVVSHALMMPEHKLADKVATLNPDLEPGDFNKAWTTGTPLSEIVGTGPFVLSEYVPDQKVTLQRNPNYWKVDPEGNQLPYVDTLEYLIVPSTEIEQAQFIAGQIDALAISGAQFPDLKSQAVAGADFAVLRGQALFGSPPHWAFNWDTDNEALAEVFQQEQFRKAMAYVLDRTRIIEDVFNTLASRPGTPVAPTSSFYNPEVEQYFVEQDLEQAAALLDELGYTDTDGDGVRNISPEQELEFSITSYVESTVYPPIATILQNDLKQVGVKANLDLIQNNLVFERALSGDFETMLLGFGNQPDPQLRKAIWQPGRDLYYWHLGLIGEDGQPLYDQMTDWEQEIFDIFEEAQATLDQEKRNALYDRWQVLYAQHLPVIFIAKSDDLAAVHDWVGNYFVTDDNKIAYTNFTVFIK